MTTKQETTEHEDLPTRDSKIGKRGGGCIVDKMVGRWGPYRYRVTKQNGKQHWEYLGRTDKFKNGLVREVGNSEVDS